MFAVYCPGHASRVLLFAENITGVVNQPDGIELRWRCLCGASGTEHYVTSTIAPVEATA